MSLRISVIGAGYLGATHAAAMAELGYEVIGVEINPQRLSALREGRLPFYEPGLDDVLRANIHNGRLRFTDDAAEAAAWADIHFLCVGTPQVPGSNAADTRFLDAALDAMAPHFKPGTLVVGKSTVPVGTTVRLRERLTALVPERADVIFSWNPEFLREGHALEDTLHPDRIVVGIDNPIAEERLRVLYAPMITEGIPFLVTDFATAELVKVAANSFLATKISFINAMAEVCEAADGDVSLLAEALGHDIRIGNQFLQAGVGFGGGCLPKDIRAFQARAEEIGAGLAVNFLEDIDAINLRRRVHAVELAEEMIGDLTGKRVSVLGAAFKPDSDDVRDSPALAVARLLHQAGALVTVHDPKAVQNARLELPEVTYVEDVTDAFRRAEVVLHLTEWREYRALDPEEMLRLVDAPNIIDGRNVLETSRWINAGWNVKAFGRSVRKPVLA